MIRLEGIRHNMSNNLHDYSDIINMERPKFENRKKMSMLNRAAQFAPFAALSGHKEAVDEKTRLTERKIALSEDIRELLDYKLQEVERDLLQKPIIRVNYFVPDLKKDGGRYEIYEGELCRINKFNKYLEFVSGKRILLDDLYSIQY